jgi:peroxiredoxin
MFRINDSRKWWVTGACVAAGAAWMIVTVNLATTVRSWKPLVRESRELRILPMLGSFVPALNTSTIEGTAITLGETASERSQVFIGIQAACPLCREMMPQLRQIADSIAASQQHDVVWLSLSPLDSTAQYVAEHGITQPVVLLDDERTSVLFGIRAVPTVLVVDREGRIRYRHAGRFGSAVSVDSVRLMALTATAVWSRPAPLPASVSLATPK